MEAIKNMIEDKKEVLIKERRKYKEFLQEFLQDYKEGRKKIENQVKTMLLLNDNYNVTVGRQFVVEWEEEARTLAIAMDGENRFLQIYIGSDIKFEYDINAYGFCNEVSEREKRLFEKVDVIKTLMSADRALWTTIGTIAYQALQEAERNIDELNKLINDIDRQIDNVEADYMSAYILDKMVYDLQIAKCSDIATICGKNMKAFGINKNNNRYDLHYLTPKGEWKWMMDVPLLQVADDIKAAIKNKIKLELA